MCRPAVGSTAGVTAVHAIGLSCLLIAGCFRTHGLGDGGLGPDAGGVDADCDAGDARRPPPSDPFCSASAGRTVLCFPERVSVDEPLPDLGLQFRGTCVQDVSSIASGTSDGIEFSVEVFVVDCTERLADLCACEAFEHPPFSTPLATLGPLTVGEHTIVSTFGPGTSPARVEQTFQVGDWPTSEPICVELVP